MGKFNANSLSYEQNLPPFLARLQEQHNGGNRDGPDPILAAQRRAAKKRSASEEAEDAPLVLDDRGEAVAGVTFGKDGKASMQAATADDEGQSGKEGQTRTEGTVDAVAGIGAGRKKKIGKVIGGGEDDDDKDAAGDSDRRKRKRSAEEGSAENAKHTKDSAGKDKEVKSKSATPFSNKDKKKKKKKIQLSFEDDEDEG